MAYTDATRVLDNTLMATEEEDGQTNDEEEKGNSN